MYNEKNVIVIGAGGGNDIFSARVLRLLPVIGVFGVWGSGLLLATRLDSIIKYETLKRHAINQNEKNHEHHKKSIKYN